MTDSMHKDPSLSQRIWAGDVTAVEDARKRYEADPDGQFVPWISTLYSYRDRVPACIEELKALLPQILEKSHPQKLLFKSESPAQAADRADVLSAVLAWIPVENSRDIRSCAYHLAAEACHWSRVSAHTEIFLAIRAASLMLELDGCCELGHAARLYADVAYKASRVKDPNQRARVYRALAGFHRRALKLGRMDSAALLPWYVFKSLTVRGIPWDVRRKTLRALWSR